MKIITSEDTLELVAEAIQHAIEARDDGKDAAESVAIYNAKAILMRITKKRRM